MTNFIAIYFQKWDAVKLVERNDSEIAAHLELRVPSQASLFIQKIVNELATLIGRTLPPKYV